MITRRIVVITCVSSICLSMTLLGAGCDRNTGKPLPQSNAEAVSDHSTRAEPVPTVAPASEEKNAEQHDASEAALYAGTEEQQELLARAKVAFLSDAFPLAERLFNELLQTEPMSAPKITAMLALGQVYLETDRENEALALYDSHVDTVLKIPEALVGLGRTYEQMSQTQRAMSVYKKALEAQPNYVFLWSSLGILATRIGESEKAGEYFLKYEQQLTLMAARVESDEAPAEEKIQILDVFSLVEDERALAATLHALGEDHAGVRAHAVRVLGEIQAQEAREKLEELAVEDPDHVVREMAKLALQAL